jgi:hypothetical protein
VSVRIEEDSVSWFAQPVSRSDVRIDATASHVRLESVSDSLPWLFSGNAPDFHYNVRIPRRANLRIKDYKSDADIDDLQAELELETYKGSMRVREHSGSLRVNTYKGTVRADFRDFRGNSSFDTYKGNIELGLPRGSGFELRNDLQRKAALDSDFAGNRRNGAVNGGGPDLRLKSYKGRFRLVAR